MLFEAAFGTQISISPLSESITASPRIPHGVAAIGEENAPNTTQKHEIKMSRGIPNRKSSMQYPIDLFCFDRYPVREQETALAVTYV